MLYMFINNLQYSTRDASTDGSYASPPIYDRSRLIRERGGRGIFLSLYAGDIIDSRSSRERKAGIVCGGPFATCADKSEAWPRGTHGPIAIQSSSCFSFFLHFIQGRPSLCRARRPRFYALAPSPPPRFPTNERETRTTGFFVRAFASAESGSRADARASLRIASRRASMRTNNLTPRGGRKPDRCLPAACVFV